MLLLFYLLLSKQEFVKIFLKSDPNYRLILRDGNLKLTRKDINFKFGIKRDECKWPILKHIHTPKDLYNYLIHVLDGPKWRMIGKADGFQIKNGMYCITGLTDIIKGCNIDYPMVITPCCDDDTNQWFTTKQVTNDNTKDSVTVVTSKERSIGFPYEKYITDDEKLCENEGNGKDGGENDEFSITKRIAKKVNKLPDDGCNNCTLSLDTNNDPCEDQKIVDELCEKSKVKDVCEEGFVKKLSVSEECKDDNVVDDPFTRDEKNLSKVGKKLTCKEEDIHETSGSDCEDQCKKKCEEDDIYEKEDRNEGGLAQLNVVDASGDDDSESNEDIYQEEENPGNSVDLNTCVKEEESPLDNINVEKPPNEDDKAKDDTCKDGLGRKKDDDPFSSCE